ncbi:peptidyl-prolyl cis-trans isomerase [Candidatus Dependentiae bacterium]|nr:peptidyl-prolyl cis-trans isomerase [Candidatus Dependentiae bacterium]
MKTHLYRSLQGVFALSILAVLPQCDFFGSKNEERTESSSAAADQMPAGSGEVLLSIDGKPRITVDRFENYVSTVLEAQPQLKQLIALMPDAEMELFKSMANEEMLQAWLAKSGMDQKEAYKKDLQMIVDFGKRQLAVKYFQEAHPVTVSEAEVRKYYDENKKTIPELMMNRGGVAAQIATFDKQADAQAFFAKVKEGKADFEQAAREAKGTVKSFQEINEMSFDVDPAVREKINSMKKFPAIEMATGKDKAWVIKATAKKDAQYVPFDQIKPRIEAFLQQQKMGELFTKELESLRNEFKIVENKDYFERKKKLKEEEMNNMMEKGGQKQGMNQGDEEGDSISQAPSAIKGA